MARPGGRNRLRIVGGTLRRRSLRFPDRPGLRPTPDRVRETLFNWLTGRVRQARCVDLFAGSGALGLEALSRGAARCWFVERDRRAADSLAGNLAELGVDDAGQLLRQDARQALSAAPWAQEGQIDLLFIDPPFAVPGLGEAVLAQVADAPWLSADAVIYIEYPAESGEPDLPAGWQIHRQGRAGESACLLLQREEKQSLGMPDFNG
ncbi:MAG: 16S rRNA (guanine(966)-N(2))-methyltransferase RsmD [Halothiobacillaceae bacterium]